MDTSQAIQQLPPPPPTPLEFHLFPKLPVEIRCMVWRLAIPYQPRLVYLERKQLKRSLTKHDSNIPDHEKYNKRSSYPNHPSWTYLRHKWEHWALPEGSITWQMRPDAGIQGFTSDAPIPALAFGNKESLSILEKVYQKSFSTLYSKPETWFNFEVDTLYIRQDDFAYLVAYDGHTSMTYDGRVEYMVSHEKCLENVKRLAVLVDEDILRKFTLEICFWDLLSVFSGLEKLHLVVEHHQHGETDASEYVLMDPINLEELGQKIGEFEASVEYLNFEHERIYRYLSLLPLPDAEEAVADYLDEDVLQKFRLDHIRSGRREWAMPEISDHIVTTKDYKQYIEDNIKWTEELIKKADELFEEANYGKSTAVFGGNCDEGHNRRPRI